ncbi:MAG: FemAB family PEP-CTERM system-associated protein [Gammaproteobacteria bacterium]|nr:FemAB family PEP-CTERM system-associated protein [Gammaproteobacteria bacterium]
MSQNQAKLKNQILLNPVALFSSQYPDTGSDERLKLGELWNQLQLLKKQTLEIQIQTKIISRKIGEAKKINLPTNELMHAMKQQSSERKQLEVKIGIIENQILDFFIIGNNKDQSITKPVITSSSSRHTISEVDLDTITICLLDNEENAWNDYVSKQPAASIHHLTHWRDILRKTYSIDSHYLFACDKNKEIVGVLPMVRLKSRLFGDILVSMPFFQRGGAIADHPLIEHKLMKAANEEAARLGIDHTEYRDDIPRDGLPVQSHKVNMILALPNSEEALWASFTAKLRAQIKRPQQLTPKVLIGGKKYLDDFYKVYSRNMRDLGSPAHSKQLIENILTSFPDNSHIIVIRLNNKPVSAGLLLCHGNGMEIPLASTIRDYNQHSMNMLLYWEVLKFTVNQGYNHFDFGRSSKNTGTYLFKRQWGAQPKQLYWHYWLGNTNQLPSLNPSNPKYALIVNIWKRLPVKLAQWLGPFIVKNIP